MASLCIHCNSVLVKENKVAGGVFTKSSNILIFFLAQILALTQVSATTQVYAPVSTFVLSPSTIYIDVDLQKTTRLTLEFFIKRHEYGQL